MQLVKNHNITRLQQLLLGRNVRFTSDCSLFPNFNVRCKVVKVYMRPGEVMFDVILPSGKKTKIGGNMSNLSFELV